MLRTLAAKFWDVNKTNFSVYVFNELNLPCRTIGTRVHVKCVVHNDTFDGNSNAQNISKQGENNSKPSYAAFSSSTKIEELNESLHQIAEMLIYTSIGLLL